jgi:hypothetical protein
MNFFTHPTSKIALSYGLAREVSVRGHMDWVATVYDADSRRWLKVTCRRAAESLADNGESKEPFEEAYPICAAIRAELDAGPPNLTALVLTLDGQVLCRSTDPYDDVTPGTHYAALGDYQIPAHTKVMGRDELIEVDRLLAFVDVVTPVSSSSPGQERLVFKHYQYVYGIPGNWNSIHIGAKLSNHPHIAPVRHVIVDETDRSRVVGFTVPFYPGGNLRSKSSRPLKLKWISQLLQTVDDLHLKYGVIHGDLHEGNMLIDPATDNLVLIDFGCSQKIGIPYNHYHHRAALTHEARQDPLWDTANDIRWVIHTVYRLVTGIEGCASDGKGGIILTSTAIIKKGGWVKGPDVVLDSPVEEYYRVCMDWLRARNAGPKITKHCQASKPLNYPDYMPPPEADIKAYEEECSRKQAALAKNPPPRREQQALAVPRRPGSDLLEDMLPPPQSFNLWWTGEWWRELERDRCATSGRNFLRLNAMDAGHSVLSWDRPMTAHLDHSRPLLANGKYQDEYSCASAIATNQRKRKHKEEEEEEESRDDNKNHCGTPSGGETSTPTRRITRSAAKKHAGAAKPTARKPSRKPAGKVVRPRAEKAARTIAIAITTKTTRHQNTSEEK